MSKANEPAGRDWDLIKTNAEFLKVIKDEAITYSKLKNVLFGNIAIKVIRAIRKHKHDKKCFPSFKKYHEVWYMTKVAFEELNKTPQP